MSDSQHCQQLKVVESSYAFLWTQEKHWISSLNEAIDGGGLGLKLQPGNL